jgi:hypothetical protein
MKQEQEFVARLQEERTQLRERKEKLEAFIRNEKFKQLPFVKQSLMRDQLKIMTNYFQVLTARLELETDTNLQDATEKPTQPMPVAQA